MVNKIGDAYIQFGTDLKSYGNHTISTTDFIQKNGFFILSHVVVGLLIKMSNKKRY